MITTEVDKAQLERVKRQLEEVKNGAPRAMTRALNAVAKQGKTRAVKLGSQEINLKQAKLREEIYGPDDSYANKATFQKQESKITARLRGLRIMNFVTNYTDSNAPIGGSVEGWLKGWAKTKVGKSNSPIPWKGGFFLPLKNTGGLVGLFTREGSSIKHRYGPSPSQIFNNIRERPEYSEGLNEYLITELDRQVGVILDQANKIK